MSLDLDTAHAFEEEVTLPHIRVDQRDLEPTRVVNVNQHKPVEGTEEDDDEDDEFVEPFSLLECMLRERFRTPTEVEPFAAVEVICYRGTEIHDLLRADPGQSVRLDADGFQLVSLDSKGGATLFFRPGFTGAVVTGGQVRSLASLSTERFRVSIDDDLFAVALSNGDYAQVVRGGAGYLLRFVHPPIQPRALSRWPRFNWAKVQMIAGSIAIHLLVLGLLGFTGAEADLTVVEERETFATPGSFALPLEKPKPKKEPAPPKAAPTHLPKITATHTHRRRPSVFPKKRKAATQRRQVKKVLAALETMKPAGPGRSLGSLVRTRINAVRSPSGSGGFRVAGVLDKIGGSVRIAGSAGGGGAETRTGSELLGSSGRGVGGLVASAGTGHRAPRGRVKRPTVGRITCHGGVLNKAAIQKVVNRHMHEVQRCYEVQLLANPRLQGKIVFEWTIAPSGRVSSARQVSSTLSSPAVASCVLARIRTWVFPRPRGGSVKVRYPFVFRVQGF